MYNSLKSIFFLTVLMNTTTVLCMWWWHMAHGNNTNCVCVCVAIELDCALTCLPHSLWMKVDRQCRNSIIQRSVDNFFSVEAATGSNTRRVDEKKRALRNNFNCHLMNTCSSTFSSFSILSVLMFISWWSFFLFGLFFPSSSQKKWSKKTRG